MKIAIINGPNLNIYKTSAGASSVDISADDANAVLMDIKVNDVFIGDDNLGSIAEFTAALNA